MHSSLYFFKSLIFLNHFSKHSTSWEISRELKAKIPIIKLQSANNKDFFKWKKQTQYLTSITQSTDWEVGNAYYPAHIDSARWFSIRFLYIFLIYKLFWGFAIIYWLGWFLFLFYSTIWSKEKNRKSSGICEWIVERERKSKRLSCYKKKRLRESWQI